MALSVSLLASEAVTTGATGLQINDVGVANAGDWIVLCIAMDNSAGEGDVTSMSSVTDTDNNTWTLRRNTIYDPGNAQTGAEVLIYTAELASAWDGTENINLTFATTTQNKCYAIYRVSRGAGETIQFKEDNSGLSGSGTSVIAGSALFVDVGEAIFGALAIETDDTFNNDSDTDGGPWVQSTLLADGGADGSCMTLHAGYKVMNSYASTTLQITLSTGRDYATSGLLVLKAVSAGGSAGFPGNGSLTSVVRSLLQGSDQMAGAGEMTPFALRQHVIVPDGDLADGTWTTDTGGADLWTAIDEATANDADFIRSANSPSSNSCEVSMTNPSFSQLLEGIVEYRYAKVGTGQIDITVALKQGAATIATWTHTNVGTTETTASQVLTAPQIAAITDVNALSLQFTANAP